MGQVDCDLADIINWLHRHYTSEQTYRASHEVYSTVLAYAQRTFPETFGHTQAPHAEVLMTLLRELRKLQVGTPTDPFKRRWVDKRDVVPLQPMECAATYY